MSTLTDYYFELANKALTRVDPVPPAPSTPTRAITEAQENNREPAVIAIDWAVDTRPTYRLSDAEVLAKMNWQFQSLCKRERQFREFEVPTVFPAKDQL